MEIFGIGGAELIAILLIMLIVAGPKRMIQWAYVLGQYTAKLRAMWAETMNALQKELNESGVDVQLPKDIPTRSSLTREFNKQIEKVASPVTKPIQDTLNETRDEITGLKQQATVNESNGTNKPASPSANGKSDFGTWSSGDKKE